MTWVAVLFDFKGKLPPADALNSAGFKPPVMGVAGDLRERISAVWSGIDWNNHKCYYEADEASILVSLSICTHPDPEPIDCVLLELGYGRRYTPYAALERLCTRYGWSVFDTEINEFLGFPNPDQSGRDRIRNRAAPVVRRLKRAMRQRRGGERG